MNVVQVTPDPYPQFVVMSPSGRLSMQTTNGQTIIYYTREAAEAALAEYEYRLREAQTTSAVIERARR